MKRYVPDQKTAKRATLNLKQRGKKGILGFPKTATTNAHGSGCNDQALGRYLNS